MIGRSFNRLLIEYDGSGSGLFLGGVGGFVIKCGSRLAVGVILCC